ncbi:MAG: S41 family peptidase, partial [Deltaproteobacteria bacterium]|nr:S41 family peptidase [Deltaproteobacteria bacterium]
MAALLVVGANHTKAGPISTPYSKTHNTDAEQRLQTTLVINSACDRISKGDFENARQIINNSNVSGSKDIIKLKKIVDESIAVKAGLKALQSKVYIMHVNEFEKLRQKGIPKDAEDIDEIFSVVLKILKHADKGQKQALLEDTFLIRTIQIAKAKAAEFEAKGKWLDAYTICYGRLKQIYEENKEYLDHAQMLLEKNDILTSLQNTPCQTSQERYAGIDKQMFIKAVDFMDYSYIEIIDYRRMAIKAINRCNMLVEVISNPYIETEYKIRSSKYQAWSEALKLISDKVNESLAGISKDEFTNVFEQTLMLNKSHRIGIDLPPMILIAQFAEGALSALDPYTAVYWPSQTKDLEKALTDQFSGIGIKFSKQQGLTKVISVIPDTPAHKSDLQAGDIITAVDGIDMKNAPDCVVKRITGPEDTKVTLTISRPDENITRDVTLNRARITVPSVYGWQNQETGKWQYMLDNSDKIGYVHISSFNSRTPDDFESALTQLENNGLKGLILDLRSNPGGLLSAAVEIADKFITEGLIVRTQPRSGMATYKSAHKELTHADYPVVVLINSMTASASEILAGVLQDKKYKRAIVVGQRSYGKGTVQAITDYCGNSSQLKYTTAYYHLPSGKKVQSREMMKKSGRTDWGILPGVTVDMQSDELKTITE